MPRCVIKDCTVEKAKFNLPGVRTNCVCRNHANKSMTCYNYYIYLIFIVDLFY